MHDTAAAAEQGERAGQRVHRWHTRSVLEETCEQPASSQARKENQREREREREREKAKEET